MLSTHVSTNDAKPGTHAMAANTMLAPHPSAALEYWYFKVNAGPTALIVDWIARRRANEHWLRVSIHSPHKREVLFEKRAVFMSDGHDFLSDRRTAGRLGDVSWELDIDPGADWIAPDIFPARLLRMLDIVGVSAPLATFSGSDSPCRASCRAARYAGARLPVLGTPASFRVVVGVGQPVRPARNCCRMLRRTVCRVGCSSRAAVGLSLSSAGR